MGRVYICDVCNKNFDIGFKIEMGFLGGTGHENAAEYRFDIGSRDVCSECFEQIRILFHEEKKNDHKNKI